MPGRNAQDGPYRDPVDSKLILEGDIFRVRQAPGAQLQKAQAVPPERPKTESGREVSLRLLGTVVDEGGASYAIIENPGVRSQDVYRVGDSIGDARVERIMQNRVVVLNGGVSQTLELALTGGHPVAGNVVASAPAPVPTSASSGAVLRATSPTERLINARASVANQNKALEFLQRMKLSPHRTNGEVDGLAISGLAGSPLAQLSGLQDGDVVQRINGHPVPGLAKAVQVLKKARSLGSARVDLKRGQEGKSLTFRTSSW
jgi:general secretion pathway protein C